MLLINAETVSGLVIPAAVKKWLSAEKVVALGSDLHGVKTGYTDFLQVKKKLGGLYEEIMYRTKTLLGR